MSSEDSGNEFEKGDAGANLVFPKAGGKVRKGDEMIIKGKPCKVTSLTVSKTGKHGHAKAHVYGLDIFTGKKYEDVFPTSHNVECPFVKKLEVEVVDIEDDTVTYMDDEGETEEIDLPEREEDQEWIEDLKKAVEEERDCWINLLSAMGQPKVTGWRETRKKED